MLSPSEVMEQMQVSVISNLSKCCREMMEYDETGNLSDGMVKFITNTLASELSTDSYDTCMDIVIREIARQAITHVVAYRKCSGGMYCPICEGEMSHVHSVLEIRDGNIVWQCKNDPTHRFFKPTRGGSGDVIYYDPHADHGTATAVRSWKHDIIKTHVYTELNGKEE